jgi:hypothetical protein
MMPLEKIRDEMGAKTQALGGTISISLSSSLLTIINWDTRSSPKHC